MAGRPAIFQVFVPRLKALVVLVIPELLPQCPVLLPVQHLRSIREETDGEGDALLCAWGLPWGIVQRPPVVHTNIP